MEKRDQKTKYKKRKTGMWTISRAVEKPSNNTLHRTETVGEVKR